MRIACLHGRGEHKVSTRSKGSVESVLDAVWLTNGLHVAATLAGRTDTPGTLALLGPDGAWRRLDPGIRGARFSVEANALLFEATAPKHIGGGLAVSASTVKVVDLSTGAVTTIGGLADPRWEAEGKAVLATKLDRQLEETPRAPRVHSRVSRVRWERRSGSTSVLGQGDAQIPSPRSDAIAWRDAAERPEMPAYPAGDRCALKVGTASAAHEFSVEGPLCLGSADDRSIRFSPDGKWLAFSSFDGPVPRGTVPVGDGRSDPPMFLRIVSPAGGVHPAAERVRVLDIEARQVAKKVDPASMRRGYRWLDWSPASTAIAAEDSDGAILIFDLAAGTRTLAGKGRAPTYDEQGEHVLVIMPTGTGEEAVVIHREAGDKRESLGRVRDARWLARSACDVATGSTRDGR